MFPIFSGPGMSCGSEAQQKQQTASSRNHRKTERNPPNRKSSDENENHHSNQVRLTIRTISGNHQGLFT